MTQLLHRSRPTAERRGVSVRVVAEVTLGPAVAGAALIAAVVLVLLLADGGDFAGTGAIAAAVWLSAHQVPQHIDGAPLSVLPLLPTIGLVAGTARSVRTAVTSSGWTGDRVVVLAAAAVAGPVVLALLAMVLLADRPALLPVDGVAVVPTLLAVAAVHAVGAALGALAPSGRLAALRESVPGWAWRGIELVPRALLGLLSGGALLVAASLFTHLGAVGRLYGPDPSTATLLGLTVVSLLYLPNVIVGATSVGVGPGAELGHNTVSAFGTVGGPVPPLPILGGLPATSSSWLWLVLLVVPVAVGVLVGHGAARRAADVTEAVRASVACAGVTGVALALLGWAAGGRLGAGAFDPVEVPALLFGAIGAVWLGLVGAGTAGIVMYRSGSGAVAQA